MKKGKIIEENSESPEEFMARYEKEKEEKLKKLIVEAIVGATLKEYREEIKKREQEETDNRDV